jgi:hypothetical protein
MQKRANLFGIQDFNQNTKPKRGVSGLSRLIQSLKQYDK